ncbi:MAG: hypothetical protein A2W25_02850 [candidate division Zixibacteria bacterium RBG_16_53_22]|nr:MAG: hypothetical protein A2W25_02850 [candidate division Zixibacteria bacterium RBG_16_53_22]
MRIQACFITATFLLTNVVIYAEDWINIGGLGECTVGVFGGGVTADGRPMIWKNRDVGNPDQRFIHCSPYSRDGITTLALVGDCYRNDTTRIYMGANERGFAVMNSDSYNLGDSLSYGTDDGTLMRIALETCRTLGDFEALLDSTNITGRRDCWNFGCLDSTGASALYECANYGYVRYAAQDTGAQSGMYIIRANFSLSGNVNHTGQDRYDRACSLTANRAASYAIDAGFVLESLARDLANIYDDPYPLPYNGIQHGGPAGYIYNSGVTICNRSTTSAVVIRGTRGDEPAHQTTIFAMLGQPILSVAFPLWVRCGNVPEPLSNPQGAPVVQYCNSRSRQLYDNPQTSYHLNSRYLLDEDGHGVYSYTLPLEKWGIDQAGSMLENWSSDPPSASEVYYEENRIAGVIFTGFYRETAELIDDFPPEPPPLPNTILISNYPNPFNDGTFIHYAGASVEYPVTLRIYDIQGRQIARIAGNNNPEGTVYWAGKDSFDNKLASGIYLYVLDNGPLKADNKMLLIR